MSSYCNAPGCTYPAEFAGLCDRHGALERIRFDELETAARADRERENKPRAFYGYRSSWLDYKSQRHNGEIRK